MRAGMLCLDGFTLGMLLLCGLVGRGWEGLGRDWVLFGECWMRWREGESQKLGG